MTAGSTVDWERHADGAYISVPIAPSDLDEVRAWCSQHCRGDYMVVLGRRVLFQSREDAALATLWWRAEER